MRFLDRAPSAPNEDGNVQKADSAPQERPRKAAFKAPYEGFWAATLGLALEGCAGEFRRFAAAPSAAATHVDAAVAQAGCVVLALVVLFIAVRRRREGFAFARRAWGVGAALCFSFGLALYFQEQLFVTSLPELSGLGYFLVVVAGFLYLLVWYDRLFAFGAKAMLLTAGASLALRGVCQMLLLVLQQTPSTCLLVVLPVASLPFFLRTFSESGCFEREDVREDNQEYRAIDLRTTAGKAALVTLAVIIGLLAFYSNSGLSMTSFVNVRDDGFFTTQAMSVATNVVFGLLLFGFALVRFRKVLFMIFFLAVIALASLAAFSANSDNETLRTLGSFALTGSRKCLDFAVIYPAFMLAADGVPQFRWFVSCRVLVGAGSLVGGLMLSNSSVGVPLEAANVITGVLLSVLFISLIVLFVCLDEAPGSAKAEPSPAEPIHRPFKESLDRIASEAGLTPAETAVLELIARGHNAESARKELVISVNTAKTHIRNIYAKLGIHSQQELIALVDRTKESIVDTYRS